MSANEVPRGSSLRVSRFVLIATPLFGAFSPHSSRKGFLSALSGRAVLALSGKLPRKDGEHLLLFRLNRQRCLQLETQRCLRGEIDVFASRRSRHRRARASARPRTHSGSFTSTCQSSDQCATGSNSAYGLRRALAFSFDSLSKGVGAERVVSTVDCDACQLQG